VVLTVRLTPRGGRDALEGAERRADGTCVLKARVRAAPHEGEANAALIKLVATELGVPGRSISLAGGANARVKQLRISGDVAALAAALEKICAMG
jgi:uncharacterized protein YggU (UPF0235/DUF167 family)